MSLSSSSIFGSSAIFDSFAICFAALLGGLGCSCLARGVVRTEARKPRARQGQLPDGLRLTLQVALERSKLLLERGQRRIAVRLGLDDGPGHLTYPKLTMADMVPPLQLCDVTMCVAPLPFLDEQGGQQAALPLAL